MHLVQFSLSYLHLCQVYPNGIDDVNYATHAALDSNFGPSVVKPFSIVGDKPNSDHTFKVLAYSDHDADALQELASELATPEWYACVKSVVSKPMPKTWAAGRELRLGLRTCPVRRSGNTEGDLFMSAVRSDPTSDRHQVYSAWVSSLLEDSGAVTLQQAPVVERFHTSRVVRRDQETKAVRHVTIPDVTFDLNVVVKDGERFNELLCSGVGRHRSFGFGMILVRLPPR